MRLVWGERGLGEGGGREVWVPDTSFYSNIDKRSVVIGASMSEPHTSLFNCDIIYIYIYYLLYIMPYIIDAVI